jgi:hypothetical protein
LRLAAAARRLTGQTDEMRQRGPRRLGNGGANRQHGRGKDHGAKCQLHFAIPPWIESRQSCGEQTAAGSRLAARKGAGGVYGTIDRTATLGKSRTFGKGGTACKDVKVRQIAGASSSCAN